MQDVAFRLPRAAKNADEAPLLHSYLLWRSSVPPDANTLAKRRYTIAASLLPALMVGVFFFGWYAGLVVLAACLSGLLTDLVACRLNGRFIFNNPLGPQDGTWLATGLIVGLLMPPAAPLWAPICAGIVAILVGKHWLSVDGMPLLQPAAVALLALHVLPPFMGAMHPRDEAGKPAWPVLVRPLTKPAEGEDSIGRHARDFLGGDVRKAISKQEYDEQLFTANRQPLTSEGHAVEAVYGPRPLDCVQEHPKEDLEALSSPHYYDRLSMLLGGNPGAIGTSQALALLAGILLCVFTGVASWILPVAGLVTLGALLWLFGSPNVTFHLLSGYTLLGLWYLAASPTTCPRSKRGMLLAGITVGILEAVLRGFLGFAEATFLSAIVVQGLAIVYDQYLAPPKEVLTRSDSGFGLGSIRGY
ncbi:MAG: RnfABCDGE type electron transport complex subunit D [Planctomycetota bacterium]|nr:RnfABCDGE type electron transport complex subunit D [Planctomycetota bacterium]